MAFVKPEVLKMLVGCFDALSEGLKKDVKASLRARARDMPAELVFRGLSYVLLLCAARGDIDVVSRGFYTSSCREFLDTIRGLDKEEAGYALYGAILLLGLREQGVISEKRFSDVVKSSIDDPVLDSIAYGLMDWIKRLAESYLER
jgi:hypothetical protein